MIYRNRNNRRNIPLVIGLLLLALANAARLVHPAGIPPGLLDALMGFLYGISIGVLFVAVRRKRRGQCAASDNGPAAS
jgi:hypothetical protein